jgi:hypothetical protein
MSEEQPVPHRCRCDLCHHECMREVLPGVTFRSLDCPECGHRTLMLAVDRELAFDLAPDYACEDDEPGDWWKREQQHGA